MKPSTIRSVVLATVVLLSGCSDGSGSTGPGTVGQTTTPQLTAKIDGAAWTSDAGAEHFGVTQTAAGVYSIIGVGSSGASGVNTFSLLLSVVSGPGTYPLGVNPTTPGGSVILTNPSGGWATAQSGADGTVTITTLTSSRIAGTFSVTLVPFTTTATGTKTMTGGSFDLEVKSVGTVGPLPDNAGSKVSATISGSAWNAATVGTGYDATTGTFVLTAHSNTRRLNMSIANVTAPGTYAFGSAPSRVMTIGAANGSPSDSYSTLGAGSSGSITITSLTSTRVKGTFTATLGPAPGSTTTGTLTVTNGTFDVGLP